MANKIENVSDYQQSGLQAGRLGKAREHFFDNLGMMIASGVPLLNALDSIEQGSHQKSAKKIIAEVREEINSGTPLWKALAYTKAFPHLAISLIQIGEESGRLSQNLKLVALQQEKQHEFKERLGSALMYPVFVLTVTVVIGLGISWFILPRLSDVLTQLDAELPLISRIMISMGAFLKNWGYIFVPATIVGFFVAIYLLFVQNKTKVIGQKMLFKIPGSKRIIQESEIARMGFLLGTLLESGMQIVTALEAMADATEAPDYKKMYRQMKERIAEGKSIQEYMLEDKQTRKLIPPQIQQMIFSGEKTGSLAETLQKIGKIYEAKSENSTKNLTVLLEPILLVIIWLAVLFVALAIIVPIYSLIGGFNDSIKF
ncbi:MAG: type II secretion system F family protein [bacterium]|nr:type II secretion system F family protein [bacterium]